MRLLVNIVIPHEPFNDYVRDGSAGQVINDILDSAKPEAIYFTEQHGMRGAVMIVNVDSAADIPALAEPWFLKFNADCEFRIAMTAEDLGKAGLGELGMRWK